MGESPLTSLLVFSQLAGWWTLWNVPNEDGMLEKAVAGWCVFYFLWAVKNRLVGPLKTDMGVVSFGFGAVGAFFYIYDPTLRLAPLALVLTSCGFATLNYILPVIGMLRLPAKDRYSKTAIRTKKSLTFARIFFFYCLSNLLFWPTAFVLLHPKLLGVPIS